MSVAAAVIITAVPLAAQTPPGPPAPGPAPAPPPSQLNFSGVIFGSYNVQEPTTPAGFSAQANNSFIVDRAYLNFRMSAGDKTSIRITTDVYQTSEGTPNAYTIRAKYAYLQYDAAKFSNGAAVLARLGILHNVAIDHEENFWPRYLSQVAIERAGYFSSADVGIAGQLTFPNKMGEAYATIVNGPGYTARERDRFKDFALRVSLTPLANKVDTPLLQSFTITGWGYKGALASTFANGTAQIPAVGEALDRTRYGAFVGIRDPRLVVAAEYAHRSDGRDFALAAAPTQRVLGDSAGRLLSAFVVTRPLAFAAANHTSPFGVVARYDRVSPTTGSTNLTTVQSNQYHVFIGGIFWDLSQKAQLALDYQESLASNNGVSVAPPTQSKAYFAHFVVNF